MNARQFNQDAMNEALLNNLEADYNDQTVYPSEGIEVVNNSKKIFAVIIGLIGITTYIIMTSPLRPFVELGVNP